MLVEGEKTVYIMFLSSDSIMATSTTFTLNVMGDDMLRRLINQISLQHLGESEEEVIAQLGFPNRFPRLKNHGTETP